MSAPAINWPTLMLTAVMGAFFAFVVGIVNWAIPGAHDEQVATGKAVAALQQQVNGLGRSVDDLRQELHEWRAAIVTRAELGRLEISIGQRLDEQGRRIDELTRRLEDREHAKPGR